MKDFETFKDGLAKGYNFDSISGKQECVDFLKQLIKKIEGSDKTYLYKDISISSEKFVAIDKKDPEITVSEEGSVNIQVNITKHKHFDNEEEYSKVYKNRGYLNK